MNISLSLEGEQALALAQKETKKPINEIIVEALNNYVEDIQDYKLALEAEKRLLENSPLLTLDEMIKLANIDASKI